MVYDTPADQIKALAYHWSYYGLELDTFGPLSMDLVLSTGGYNSPVTVGSYFAPNTLMGPTFEFDFDGRGEPDPQTNFTINAIRTADPGPETPYAPIAFALEYLDVSFTEQGYVGAPSFSGRIIFDADPTSDSTSVAPEPASLRYATIGLVGLALVFTSLIRRRAHQGSSL